MYSVLSDLVIFHYSIIADNIKKILLSLIGNSYEFPIGTVRTDPAKI